MNFRSLCLAALEMVVRRRNRFLNMIDPPLIILLYHRVADLPSDPQLLAVTRENFRSQMCFLKENLPVVRLDGEQHEEVRPAVAVTFDDGYADNCTNALPILEELELPATFFISAGDVGSDAEFWWDELERLLLLDGGYHPPFALLAGGRERYWSASTGFECNRMYDELHMIMKEVDEPLRSQWLDSLRRWAGKRKGGRSSHRIMDVSQLKRLAASPLVTIGAHGMTHTRLSSLTPERQFEEIRKSRELLTALSGQKVELFSYPFGTFRDYTRETVAVCREARFKKVFANVPGQVHSWTDHFQLPRHLVRNWTVDIFRSKLEEFWIS